MQHTEELHTHNHFHSQLHNVTHLAGISPNAAMVQAQCLAGACACACAGASSRCQARQHAEPLTAALLQCLSDDPQHYNASSSHGSPHNASFGGVAVCVATLCHSIVMIARPQACDGTSIYNMPRYQALISTDRIGRAVTARLLSCTHAHRFTDDAGQVQVSGVS